MSATRLLFALVLFAVTGALIFSIYSISKLTAPSIGNDFSLFDPRIICGNDGEESPTPTKASGDVGADPNVVDCSQVLSEVRLGVIKEQNKENGVNIKLTDTEPPFWISLHDQALDHLRWGIMEKGKYYEQVLTKSIQKVLRDLPPGQVQVLDVGGNIGWYTLVAASMGHSVSMFEPNELNIIRVCQSLHLNGYQDLVHVYQKGVSNDHGSILPLYAQANNNPGVATFDDKDWEGRDHPEKLKIGEIHMVTLDKIAEERGWFERSQPIAVMKVDVERYEYYVFSGALRLLKSKLVKNVFVEYGDTRVSDMLFENGYYVYRKGMWLGPRDPYVQTEGKNQSQSLFEQCGGSHCNVWFKPKEEETSS